jgi:hypothetical protein
MIIILLIIMMALLVVLGYFGYSIRKDQFLQIKEYATFIADIIGGRIIKWSLLFPRTAFAIVGEYQGCKIKMYLYLDQTRILIFSDKLLKQKKLMISYPEIAEGIWQIGKTLTMTVLHDELTDQTLKRTQIIEGMERLINAAKRLESNTSV